METLCKKDRTCPGLWSYLGSTHCPRSGVRVITVVSARAARLFHTPSMLRSAPDCGITTIKVKKSSEHISHQHSLSYVCGPSPRSIRGMKTGHKKPASRRKTSQAICMMSSRTGGRDKEHANKCVCRYRCATEEERRGEERISNATPAEMKPCTKPPRPALTSVGYLPGRSKETIRGTFAQTGSTTTYSSVSCDSWSCDS